MSKPRRSGLHYGHANDFPKSELSFTEALRELTRFPVRHLQMRRRTWGIEWAFHLAHYNLVVLTNNGKPQTIQQVPGAMLVDANQMLATDWIVEIRA